MFLEVCYLASYGSIYVLNKDLPKRIDKRSALGNINTLRNTAVNLAIITEDTLLQETILIFSSNAVEKSESSSNRELN